jgi:FtsP/CotA-like multicopper oxidase with cupredoxin domain
MKAMTPRKALRCLRQRSPMIFFKKTTLAVALIIILLITGQGWAAVTEYDLVIEQREINLTGRPTAAMTINGTVPGPTLRFREGDLARIHVRNVMAVETSIHWHGILVPPGMDGVPLISFPPIAPGETFTYEFPIRQNGTYWYHSHTNLQEQSGVYGAIVIDPAVSSYQLDREYVVLFSDWTDQDPHQVLRTLKRGSEWFALEKGSTQSLIGAARLGMLDDYLKRELQRMPAMDIADIAYDRFLANGQPEISLAAQPGETIRLRIINGSATTYFHLEFAGGPMRIIAADGMDVEPVILERLLIGVAETYDLLIQIPGTDAYEFRATAHDGSGFATVWLGEGEVHPAPDVPRPNLYHAMGELNLRNLFALTPAGSMGMGEKAVQAGKFDQPGMMSMGAMKDLADMDHGMDHGTAVTPAPAKQGMPAMTPADEHHSAHHSPAPPTHDLGHGEHVTDKTRSMQPGKTLASRSRNGRSYGADFRPMAADVSSATDLAMDGMDARRPWPPYQRLRATTPTAFDPGQPVREIRLTLDGDMERYVWFLNNKALAESDVIPVRRGEVVRFIMINRTMMHHPMHLHGHFFRVVNGQGDRAPLKHTVDVGPMSTTVIEFDANEVGDWFFHCHLLYHMESGMAGVVHYDNFTPPPAVAAIRSRLNRDSWYFWGEATALSNMTEGYLKIANTRNTLMAEWESGWERVDKNEWEGLFIWEIYLNRFFTTFIGLDLLGEGSETEETRGVIGFTYLLPFNLESRYWLDTDGGGRLMLEKIFPLTPWLALSGEVEYDTNDSDWEGGAALTYTLTKGASLTGQWHSDFGWGAGAIFRF